MMPSGDSTDQINIHVQRLEGVIERYLTNTLGCPPEIWRQIKSVLAYSLLGKVEAEAQREYRS